MTTLRTCLYVGMLLLSSIGAFPIEAQTVPSLQGGWWCQENTPNGTAIFEAYFNMNGTFAMNGQNNNISVYRTGYWQQNGYMVSEQFINNICTPQGCFKTLGNAGGILTFLDGGAAFHIEQITCVNPNSVGMDSPSTSHHKHYRRSSQTSSYTAEDGKILSEEENALSDTKVNSGTIKNLFKRLKSAGKYLKYIK